MKIRHIVLSVLLLPLLQSCENWLDVKPKSQIEAEVLFEREAGFKDALTGVYTNMISPAMYGREMTFGMADILGCAYSGVVGGNGVDYHHLHIYEYDNANAEAVIVAAWQRSYNAIANLNNLIDNLHKADREMFRVDNYNVILGEALGLRASIHFDLLRLYAPSYLVGRDAKVIPYVTRYTFETTPAYSVAAVMDSIMVDLQAASAALKQSDPIVTGREIAVTEDDGYLLKRSFHFNYYAVRATMARAYLYKADMANAAACADEVIASGKFRWTTVDEMTNPDAARRDYTFSNEQVFALHVLKMEENITARLREQSTSTGRLLYCTVADLAALYTSTGDWRYVYYWVSYMAGGNNRLCNKFYQYDGMPSGLPIVGGKFDPDYRCRLPMIRLPELYLISAEAALATDLNKTRERLRTLRINRGISGGAVAADATAEWLRNEITQEYRREFVCEGQLFYYYKRLDFAKENIKGVASTFDKSKYVLPRPQEEVEFGQRD